MLLVNGEGLLHACISSICHFFQTCILPFRGVPHQQNHIENKKQENSRSILYKIHYSTMLNYFNLLKLEINCMQNNVTRNEEQKKYEQKKYEQRAWVRVYEKALISAIS